jgi:hypothetical protein
MANSKTLGVRGPYRVFNYPVKSDASFKEGDFVLLTSTGLYQAAAAGANFADVTNNATRIAGRALAPAVDPNTGAVNAFVQIIAAEPHVEFEVPLYHATPASAVPALTQIGTGYEMRQSSGGFPQIDVGTTTNAHARITDFAGQDDTPNWPTSITGGVQYANCYVEFYGDACLNTGAR